MTPQSYYKEAEIARMNIDTLERYIFDLDALISDQKRKPDPCTMSTMVVTRNALYAALRARREAVEA